MPMRARSASRSGDRFFLNFWIMIQRIVRMNNRRLVGSAGHLAGLLAGCPSKPKEQPPQAADPDHRHQWRRHLAGDLGRDRDPGSVGRAAVEAHRVLRLRSRRHPRGFADRRVRACRASSPRTRTSRCASKATPTSAVHASTTSVSVSAAAQAVRRALLLPGVAEVQITTVSYGEERPAAAGSDEQAYGLNRRVEIVYLK